MAVSKKITLVLLAVTSALGSARNLRGDATTTTTTTSTTTQFYDQGVFDGDLTGVPGVGGSGGGRRSLYDQGVFGEGLGDSGITAPGLGGGRRRSLYDQAINDVAMGSSGIIAPGIGGSRQLGGVGDDSSATIPPLQLYDQGINDEASFGGGGVATPGLGGGRLLQDQVSDGGYWGSPGAPSIFGGRQLEVESTTTTSTITPNGGGSQ